MVKLNEITSSIYEEPHIIIAEFAGVDRNWILFDYSIPDSHE